MRDNGWTFAAAYARDRNNFDLIRFALATTVIWSHCVSLLGRGVDYGAAIAVNVFFIVSGFLVMQSWIAYPRLAIYGRKRALRILPGLALALAFGALVIAPFGTDEPASRYFQSAAPWRHFASVVFHRYLEDDDLFRGNPVPGLLNLPLWSLRYEILCYALVPLVGLLAAPTWRVGVGLLLVAVCIAQPAPTLVAATDPLHVHLFACFTAGAFFYVFRDRVPHHAGLAAVALALLIASYATRAFPIALPLAGGYLVLYLAFARWLPAQRFGRYGDFSYGLYVLAFPVQQLIIDVAGAGMSPLRFFAVAFASTLPLAIASWYLVEAPALALKPHTSHPAAAVIVPSS